MLFSWKLQNGPQNFDIFSMAMGADYSLELIFSEPCAPQFNWPNKFFLASVSSKHEKRCQMLETLFFLFQCSKNPLWANQVICINIICKQHNFSFQIYEKNTNQHSGQCNYSVDLFLLVQASALGSRDEFELEFSGSSRAELWRFRAGPSRAGAL